MKHAAVAGGLLLSFCMNLTPAEAQSTAPVEVGKTYRVFMGLGPMEFKILEVGKGGLVKVTTTGAPKIGVEPNSVWWLNLNQALLVEAK